MNGRDHGGGLDAAMARHGGSRLEWLDLSTGINPVPYPVPALEPDAWTRLPDRGAMTALEQAARRFWNVPVNAAVLAAPGASALIARIPTLTPPGGVVIPGPTYNEHEAAFRQHGWNIGEGPDAMVVVHPNNPDGRLWRAEDLPFGFTVIDESFCDVMPAASLIDQAARPGRLVLKSFGKFWGLAGVRLGFAIGDPRLVDALAQTLGPWPVSGIALQVGAAALSDADWADRSRARLAEDARRLDSLMRSAGALVEGGTTLFRLYRVDDAAAWQDRLAGRRIWSRIFPYSDAWLRLGLPAPDRWDQVEAALA